MWLAAVDFELVDLEEWKYQVGLKVRPAETGSDIELHWTVGPLDLVDLQAGRTAGMRTVAFRYHVVVVAVVQLLVGRFELDFLPDRYAAFVRAAARLSKL